MDVTTATALRRRPAGRALDRLLRAALFALAAAWPAAQAQDPGEYRLKAAFLYNFALFTEWPDEVGTPIVLCIHGADPFGRELDALQGKTVGTRTLAVQRKVSGDSLKGCQVVFIASTSIAGLARVLDELRGLPVLTVADSPGAAGRGVALNMSLASNRVAFEANLQAARSARLVLSSKLLRLATEVYP